MIPCTLACWLLGADALALAAPATGLAPVAAVADTACVACHREAGAILVSTMATREPERAFCRRAFGDEGEAFFGASCLGCHVTSCRDCHGEDAHATGRPDDEVCLRCHRGSYTGWEYAGRAPREDHERYQRGSVAQGEHYLPMLPDVHHELGLGCVDCHQVHGEGVKSCRDCHATVSPDVPEHAITAHLDKMECWACHSAWAAQEYGTYLVKPVTDEQREAFDALPAVGPWRRSAVLRQQGPPPLGLDARGLVSPIRPRYILLVTDPGRGWHNRLVAAEWQPFLPHTIRRGTVTCGGCHDQPRRFVLEPPQDRIYDLGRDGLPLASWWDQTGQRVAGGAFFSQERFDAMNRRTPAYVREHLRLWRDLLEPGASSSGP